MYLIKPFYPINVPHSINSSYAVYVLTRELSEDPQVNMNYLYLLDI